MDHSATDFNSSDDQEALFRLSRGEATPTIYRMTYLRVEIISFLCIQQMAIDCAAHADLSCVSPSFRFDYPYFDLVRRYFHYFPQPLMQRIDLTSSDVQKALFRLGRGEATVTICRRMMTNSLNLHSRP
jgi:hypothetical protein